MAATAKRRGAMPCVFAAKLKYKIINSFLITCIEVPLKIAIPSRTKFKA